jgi:hypothetical protein
MTNIPDPYARRIWHGKLLDNATISALEVAEEHLGYELTILQGVGGAVASAGTHLGKNGEGGRAVDLSDYDADRKVAVLKRLGFAVWVREAIPGLWGPHIHGVLILFRFDNERGIAPSAFRQIGAYRDGRDGLAGNGRDPHPWRPNPIPVWTHADYLRTFEEPVIKPTRTPVTRARNRIVEAMQAVGQAAALLDDLDPGRVHARAEIDDLRATRRGLREILERMPKQ